ncbi:type IV pilus biogenesis protein PilM [Pseudomonas parasichuanensis]|uniref:type IV pilus biogenesis protein PilM n=1 Tax=Pseudomonas parasichuanensis TaxID=2892329 RepID=UPI001F240249|nr:pilus assembly protein PilM [Pseudomonas parasichuanensis]
MLGRFGKDAGSLLGVEIASDSIRMLQVRRQRGRCRVVGWVREPIDPPLRGPHLLDDDVRLVDALRHAHGRCASRQRRVALALPASQVICKVLRLPVGVCDFDAEAQLLEQADQLFPFPLDDLALDFQVLGLSAEHPGQADVLVAACGQSQIDPLEQLFARAGLQVLAMEVDSIALCRAMPSMSARTTALLQLERAEAVLHRLQAPVLPHRQQVALASPEGWLEPVERLCTQAAVGEVVLVGGAANDVRASALAERLGVTCRMAAGSDFSGLAKGREANALDASMALACGLALGGLQ